MAKYLALVLVLCVLWAAPAVAVDYTSSPGCSPGGSSHSYVCDTPTHMVNQLQQAMSSDGADCTNFANVGDHKFHASLYATEQVGDVVYACGKAVVRPSQYDFSEMTATSLSPCSGTTWSQSSMTCGPQCPAGVLEDPMNPGTCLTPDKCKARNSDLGLDPAIRTWTSACIAGCTLEMTGGTKTNVAGATYYTGTLTYSGATCGTNTNFDPNTKPTNEDPNHHQQPEPPKCVPAANGQTFCTQPDGQNCYSSSSGRQICWSPNETPGEKGDGPTLQKTCAGTSCPQFPNTPPPSPTDPFTQTNSVTSTNTTTNNAITTTTYTNYTTSGGTTVGNQGTPTGGTGTTSGGDPGAMCGVAGKPPCSASSGGDSCTAGPVSTGDPILAQIAKQTWLQRCGKSLSDKNGDGVPDYMDVSAESHDSTGENITASSVQSDGTASGTGTLDSGGYGFSRSCPAPQTFDIFGHVFTIDPTNIMCDWFTVGSYFVLLLAGIASAKIVSGAI